MNAAALMHQLRDLYEETHLAPLGADEFTASMFAEANGCGPGTANRLLNAAIKTRRIECVGDRLYLGRRAKAYKFN